MGEIDQRQHLEVENRHLEQRLQKAQRRVTELKQAVTKLEQENRSLRAKLNRFKEKQHQSEQPAKAIKGMKTLKEQLEAQAGDAQQADRLAAAEKSSQMETASEREYEEPARIDDDRLMRAYFGDRQDFSKGARGR